MEHRGVKNTIDGVCMDPPRRIFISARCCRCPRGSKRERAKHSTCQIAPRKHRKFPPQTCDTIAFFVLSLQRILQPNGTGTSQFRTPSLEKTHTHPVHATDFPKKWLVRTVATGIFLRLKERRCLPSLSSLQTCLKSLTARS